MNEGKIAVRYSKALFMLAKEENNLDIVASDILLIKNAVEEIDGFKDFLYSPILASSIKKEICKDILKNNIAKTSMQFLYLLFENKREFYLPSIIRVFIHMVKESHGIKSGLLTTAIPLDSKVQKGIVDHISKKMKTTIELETKTDEKIIGGFVLRIEDQQIDASVSSKLLHIKKELLNH